MKLRFAFLGLLSLIAVSCSYEESFVPEDNIDNSAVEFYATIDEQSDADTKVYADDQLRVLWNADDRITIFNKNTYNQQYRFTGVDGDNAGGFRIVKSDDEFITSNPLDNIYAVYPYRETNKISNDGVLTTSIPSGQTYKANSFGIGANTMVSVAESNMLKFKNVGGYLSLKFYGEGVSVSSISLKSNNGELIAGDCTVNLSSGTPVSSLVSANATDEITLTCESPVELGATASEATQFIFVLSPVTLAGGFTVTVVSPDGGMYEKSSTNRFVISRSSITRIGATEVVMEYPQPNNVIYYTSTNKEIVTPNAPDVFGASIISNEYVDGRGILTFDGDVTSIGVSAFRDCSRLMSIIIPESVTSIGIYAFYSCSDLSSINIPDHVTNIGSAAFFRCTGLTSVLLSDGVLSLGDQCFYGCNQLTSFIIPNSVENIGAGCFAGCSNLSQFAGKYATTDGRALIKDSVFLAFAPYGLKSYSIPDGVISLQQQCFNVCSEISNITLPESVTSLGDGCFGACYNLSSISIPEGVTSLPESCFGSCWNLKSIVLPQSLVSINDCCFLACSSLETITIPSQVTELGYCAFYRCRSLTSVVLEPSAVISIRRTGNSWVQGVENGVLAVFDDTNNCPIYVPVELVDTYKSAEHWSDYADRIKPFEPLTPTNFNPNSYLLYRANKTGGFIGDDYRVKVSMMPGISGAKVEMKLQLTGPGPISTGNTMRDEYDYFEIRENALVWNDIYREDGEWWDDVLSFTIPSATSLLLIQFDGVNETMTINDNTSPCHRNSMTWSRLFVDYGHESDEGIWDVYSGVPDGSKLYYVKVWDADDTLNYIGYATTSVNPDTNRTEFCWCSYYPKTGTTSYDFANDAINQGGYQGYIAY